MENKNTLLIKRRRKWIHDNKKKCMYKNQITIKSFILSLNSDFTIMIYMLTVNINKTKVMVIDKGGHLYE